LNQYAALGDVRLGIFCGTPRIRWPGDVCLIDGKKTPAHEGAGGIMNYPAK
jgi:hypothetical protein